MNARIFLSLTCAAAVLPAPAFAQKPPVKVEVVVDGEGEDFFEDDKASSSQNSVRSVRDRSDDMFNEIDGGNGVRVRTGPAKAETEDGNKSTQVVNVIVQGQKQQSANTAPTTNQAPPAPDANCNCVVKRRRRGAWWRRPSHVQRGNVMLSASGAFSNAGGFGGLRFEGMPSSQLGIQLKVHLSGFDDEDLNDRDSDIPILSNGEDWGIGGLDNRLVEGGFMHLTDLGIAWHIFNKSRFDLHPTLAISHFGYSIDVKNGPALQGGSALVRLGMGLNWHWGRIFSGFDFGWYPLELVRYELVENDAGDREGRSIDINDRFNEKRYTASAHVGIRF